MHKSLIDNFIVILKQGKTKSKMNEITKATTELAKAESNKKITLVHKLALLTNKEPLIRNAEEGQKFLCKQIVYIYTALGHTGIFNQQGGEQQIKESALIIFESIKANVKIRHLSKIEIEQAVKKGCSGEFETDEKGKAVEFKHFSPTLVLTWLRLFNAKYTPQVIREKERLNEIKLMEYKDENLERKTANLQTVSALWEFMDEETSSLIFTKADFRHFYGRFIAKELIGNYPVSEQLKKKYSNRKDIWNKCVETAEKGIAKTISKRGKMIQEQAMKKYCFEIFDLFKNEHKGDELALEMFKDTINEYHENDKKIYCDDCGDWAGGKCDNLDCKHK